jgi:uncharacterized protein
LLKSFTIFHLKTDLSSSLQQDGDELFKRIEMFNAFRNNAGMFVTDGPTEEDFNNISAPLGGLHELLASSIEQMSIVSSIPLVKLTGISPSGLNASSEGEIKVWYDSIAAYQSNFMQPNLEIIFRFAQLNLWGTVDPDLSFSWDQLSESTDSESSAIREQNARVDAIYVEAGIISQEEVRKRIAGEPDSGYDGLDVESLPDLRSEQEQGLASPGHFNPEDEPDDDGTEIDDEENPLLKMRSKKE